MASPTSFPLVRGHMMRVTAVDRCGVPLFGEEDSMVATDGFVSVALTANINTPDEISIQNAAGATCVRDVPPPEFQGYGVEITFCEVSPCLFSIVTGQPSVVDAGGDVVGFRMNSSVDMSDTGFALEVWMGVPGVACQGTSGAFGYLLLPFLQGGVVGDFTIENAAITFTVTGAVTKDGNGWATGPYNVVTNVAGAASHLPSPLDSDDHLYAIFTTVPPPAPTDGCADVPDVANPATGATAGAPGTFSPAGATPPANVANLIAGTPNTVTATPTSAWTAGQYIQTGVSGAPGEAHWSGTAWVSGRA